MNSSIRCLLHAALVLAITLSANQASARRRRPGLERASVRLQLSLDRSQQLAADVNTLDERGAPLVARCADSCALDLPQGRYRLTLHTPDGSDAMNVRLLAPGPAVYRGEPTNDGLKYVGLTALITGGALGISGAVALAIELLPRLLPHGDGPEGWTVWGAYGVVTTPVGFAIALIGMFVYKHNRHAFTEIDPEDADPPVAFGIAPSMDGATATLRAAF